KFSPANLAPHPLGVRRCRGHTCVPVRGAHRLPSEVKMSKGATFVRAQSGALAALRVYPGNSRRPTRHGGGLARRSSVTYAAGPIGSSRKGFRMARVHRTAVVSPAACLADDVAVGPFVVIDGPVTLGPGTVVRAHAHLIGPLALGSDN